MAPLTKLLYKSGAEMIVNGHDHNYERMAPARPSGKIDWKKGVQQIDRRHRRRADATHQ